MIAADMQEQHNLLQAGTRVEQNYRVCVSVCVCRVDNKESAN